MANTPSLESVPESQDRSSLEHQNDRALMQYLHDDRQERRETVHELVGPELLERRGEQIAEQPFHLPSPRRDTAKTEPSLSAVAEPVRHERKTESPLEERRWENAGNNRHDASRRIFTGHNSSRIDTKCHVE